MIMQKNISLTTLLLFFVPFTIATAQSGSATRAANLLPSEARHHETGRPFIRNYSPKEYGAHPQNWAIVQDRRGVMYFGNGLGVLEYDAVSWRLIAMPNKSVVRSLDVDESGAQAPHGRIYVGAQGDFGYLAADALGRLQFVSLLERLPSDDREFTDVWRTFATKSGIYFQTPTRLFCYTPPSIPPQGGTEGGVISQGGIKVWKPSTRFNRASLVHDQIYIPQAKIGLMQLAGDSLRLLPGTEKFAEEIYAVLLPFPEVSGQISAETGPSAHEKILIATATNGLFLYDGVAAKPFVTEAGDFLRASEIYRGTLLRDGSFALATRQGGAAVVDREGRVRIIDKDSGLRVNKIYFVYPDRQGALWLGLENGISRVETPSPFSLFGESSGLKSSVYGIIKHQSILYVSTNTGVFYLQVPSAATPGKRPVFLPVRGIAEQSWSLLSMDDNLLVATGDGVLRIKDGRAEFVKESVSESFVSLALHRSRQNENRVYVGLTDGLASLRHQANPAQWIDEGRIPGVYEQIWSIVEDEQGALWLGTDAQGVIRVEISVASKTSTPMSSPTAGSRNKIGQPRPLKVERFGVAQGLAGGGVQVFSVAGKEFFAATTGIFRFDEQRRVFVPDSTFAVVAFGNTQEEYNLKEDGNGNVWINFGKESAVALRQPNDSYFVEKTPFLRFADSPTIAIYPEAAGQVPEDEGVVWFGGAEGLVRYDGNIEKDYAQDYAALIRRVIAGNDSVIFDGAATVEESGEQADLSRSTPHALRPTLYALRSPTPTTPCVSSLAHHSMKPKLKIVFRIFWKASTSSGRRGAKK